MKDIKTDDLQKLPEDNFSVMLLWAEGCHVCDSAKPAFEELSQKYDFDFMKLQLDSESMEFYKKYEEEVPAKEYATDEDGDVILDARGNPLTRTAKNEDGSIKMTTPITVPKYYVFHGEEVSDENPDGLLGKVEGHNLEQLESILDQLVEMSEEQSA